MAKERILITVKTYPTLSSKYDEVVCTAGLREDGTWVRIYPIPFRKLDEREKFSKFDWIEVDLERNLADTRRESYRLNSDIRVLEHVDTTNNWQERRALILTNTQVYHSFDEIISQNNSNQPLSLATFKPNIIKNFHAVPDSTGWDPDKLERLRLRAKQSDMFRDTPEIFRVVDKLPYRFQYSFTDSSDHKRTLSINDWEIGVLFWRLRKKGYSQELALEKVRNKYYKELVNDRDIHFFVGTHYSMDQQKAPNPFSIIGVFSPPMIKQKTLEF